MGSETQELVKMVNHLDVSTRRETINYVLTSSPHKEKPEHPTYLEMIQGAVNVITKNGNAGTTKAAILKYMAENYHIGENLPTVNSDLRNVLSNAVECGILKESSPFTKSGKFKVNRDEEREKLLQLAIKTRNPILDNLQKTSEIQEDVDEKVEKRTMKKKEKSAKQSKKLIAKPPKARKMPGRTMILRSQDKKA